MNKQSFKHFIITAFNIDVGKKPREEILNPHYLSRRWEIFKDFCYPTVQSQTNQNFSWLVFFDEDSPNTLKDSINQLQQEYANFFPIYTPPKVNAYSLLIKLIYEKLSPLDDYLITTWLDNDDAVANDFVEQIQAQFCSQNFEYINFSYGYDVSKRGLFIRQYLANQFISLIEKVDDNIVTCKVMRHYRIYNLSKKWLPVRQVIHEPIWMHLRHESNEASKDEHSTSIPQPMNRLNKNFVVRNFIENHIQHSYLENLRCYLQENYFSASSQKLTTKDRFKNILALIRPEVLKNFLLNTLKSTKVKKSPTELSLKEIKDLCLKQQGDAIWIR